MTVHKTNALKSYKKTCRLSTFLITYQKGLVEKFRVVGSSTSCNYEFRNGLHSRDIFVLKGQNVLTTDAFFFILFGKREVFV